MAQAFPREFMAGVHRAQDKLLEAIAVNEARFPNQPWDNSVNDLRHCISALKDLRWHVHEVVERRAAMQEKMRNPCRSTRST
jgi:hypothetical protein